MIRTGFIPNITTFESLESTGKLDLIHNEDLKEKIIVYYNYISIFSENTTNNNTTLVDELINQKLIDLTLFKTNSFSKEMKEFWSVPNVENYSFQGTTKFTKEVQRKLKNLDQSLTLINVTNFRMFLANVQLDFVKQTERDTKVLIKALEDELNKT